MLRLPLRSVTTIRRGEGNHFPDDGKEAFTTGSALSWRRPMAIRSGSMSVMGIQARSDRRYPIGAVALLLVPAWLPERLEDRGPRLDLGGAISLTVGFLALIYGLARAESAGWGSPQTVGTLAAAVVVLVAFVVIERRTTNPLIPLGLFRRRAVAGANALMFLASAAFFPMFLFASQYMQQVLGFTALASGLAFVPMALTVTACSGYLSARVVARFGAAPVVTGAMITMAAGLLLLVRSSAFGSFWADVLPATLVVAAGIGTSFTALLIAATAGVPERDQGGDRVEHSGAAQRLPQRVRRRSRDRRDRRRRRLGHPPAAWCRWW